MIPAPGRRGRIGHRMNFGKIIFLKGDSGQLAEISPKGKIKKLAEGAESPRRLVWLTILSSFQT